MTKLEDLIPTIKEDREILNYTIGRLKTSPANVGYINSVREAHYCCEQSLVKYFDKIRVRPTLKW